MVRRILLPTVLSLLVAAYIAVVFSNLRVQSSKDWIILAHLLGHGMVLSALGVAVLVKTRRSFQAFAFSALFYGGAATIVATLILWLIFR